MKIQRIITIIFLSIIIVSGSVAACAKKISFEEAIKEPGLREKYVEKVVEKIGKPDYVAEINYINTKEEFEFLKRVHEFTPDSKTLMITNPMEDILISQLGKKILPVRISIFPFSFSGETLKTEGDFISSLWHEYRHGRTLNQTNIDSIDYKSFQITEGKFRGQWNLSLLNIVMELTAIRETLKSSFPISPEYREQRKSFFLENYLNIWDYEEGMSPEFIKSLKIEFFDDWFVKEIQKKLKIKGVKGLDYLENSQTGRKYYLPKEIIEKLTINGKG